MHILTDSIIFIILSPPFSPFLHRSLISHSLLPHQFATLITIMRVAR